MASINKPSILVTVRIGVLESSGQLPPGPVGVIGPVAQDEQVKA